MYAKDLRVGDFIWSVDGSGTVENITVIETDQWMYNLTVDEAHTFYVGDGQWLVHNACGEFDLATGKPVDARKQLKVGVENQTMVQGGDNAFENFAEARRIAQQRSGLDTADNVTDFVQKIGPSKGRITGRQTVDKLQGWRVDFDPQSSKGLHINYWDERVGGRKDRSKNLRGAISIALTGNETTQQLYWAILEHFPKP